MSDIEIETYQQMIEESVYTIGGAARAFGFNVRSFSKWVRGVSKPRKVNREAFVQAMAMVKKEKRLPFHPSYGYATPEQIEKLQSLGMCPEREQIKAQIEKQNEAKGKIYK